VTLPAPRDTAGPDTGGWRILEAVNRVDDAVRGLAADMAQRFDQLDRRFMPRDQVVDRFETVTRDHAALTSQLEQVRVRHEVDVERLEKAADDAETARRAAEVAEVAARRSFRRWLITTAIAAGSALAGVIGTLTVHLN
jgi:hypothetical protein